MDYPCRRIALPVVAPLALAMSLCSVPALAAPVTIKGATFDAPTACQPVEGALVCKVDGIQMELWVTRKLLAPQVAPTDPFARKMVYFNDVHDTAVGNILRSTNNDKATTFSSYGAYSALGTAMPGKGVATSPSVRFASVLHDEEIWEFLEVAATRTSAVDSLSEALQRSLVLPASASVTASAPAAAAPARGTPTLPPTVSVTPPTLPLPTKPVAAPARNASPPSKLADATSASATTPKAAATPTPAPAPLPPTFSSFSGPLLSMQYPDFLEPVVIENTVSHFAVNFKDKARAAGPVLSVNLYAPTDKKPSAAVVVQARKDAQTATMAGPSGSVDVSTLGTIKGIGFALIGVPDAQKGLSGVESIETTFAADVPRGILEVRLTAESKFSGDAEAVWALLAKSIQLAK